MDVTPPPDADLGDLLLRVARRLRHSTAEALAPMGTSPHQARALRVIAEQAPLRPSRLAEALHVTPRSATENVDHLVAQGWVQRSPDPADRRATLVTMTDSGRAAATRIAQIRVAAHRQFFEHLDAAEQQQLRNILLQLGEHVSDHHLPLH